MKNRFRPSVGALFAAVLCLHGAAKAELPSPSATTLRSSLSPFSLEHPVEMLPGVSAYLKRYSLLIDGVNHHIGTIESGTYTLVVQVFQPQQATATAVLSHGYYDHAGVLKHLIRNLVEKGYAVAVLDHAGHGLSTGAPASIGDFGEYVDGLNQLIEIARGQLPGPTHLIGHSMGCAIVIDSLLNGKELPVDKIVLIAPLVRSGSWAVSGVAFSLLNKKLKSFPRKFRKNSSNEQFLSFHKQDPLQARTIPFSWVEAHRKWHDRIHKSGKYNKALAIIQGEKDSTVDWKYNLDFLKQRMPNAHIEMIAGGGHQLMNEPLKLREQVFEKILPLEE